MIEFSERLKKITQSPMRVIAEKLEKAALDKNIISFGMGAPSIAPPKEVTDYLSDELRKDPKSVMQYISSNGLPHTRQLISEDLKRMENVDVSPEDICITVGGSSGLFSVINTFLNAGDEVISADPTYVTYSSCVVSSGGKLVSIPTTWENNFQITPEMVNEKITKKTKMFILLTPDNPTGRMIDRKNVKGIVELCEEKNILLLTDDIYKYITYGEKFVNSRTFGGYENTVTCDSFSKSCSMPGMRVGYVYGPGKVVEKVKLINSYVNLCAPKISLLAVNKFLENDARIRNDHLKNDVIPVYTKRRDATIKMLKKYIPDLKFQVPQGAFYIFPDFSRYVKNDVEFAEKMFTEKKVVIVPGSYFGDAGKNSFRFTFVSEPEPRIEEGIRKLAELLR